MIDKNCILQGKLVMISVNFLYYSGTSGTRPLCVYLVPLSSHLRTGFDNGIAEFSAITS